MNLKPKSLSANKVFLRSQFLTKPRPPPHSLSFRDQTAIVTGSNVGIGLQACAQMLSLGLSRLVMGVRSIDKGEAAAAILRQSHPSATIEVWELDMCSYDSIQAFAKRCSSLERLEFAILNAGVLKSEFKLSTAGHEEGFQVNYLSTTLLAALLLPTLRSRRPESQPGRLTIVGSSVSLTNKFQHRDAKLVIPAMDDPKNFGAAMDSYADTKMCALIAVQKLSEKVKSQDVIINIVDPGLVAASGLHRNFSGLGSAAFAAAKALTARSIEHGAWTYIDAVAVKGEDSHGGFLVDWGLHP